MTDATAPAAPVRVLIVDKATSIVINAHIAMPDYVDPAGNTVVVSETGDIGDTYANGAFARPAPPPPTKDDLMAHAAFVRWQRQTGGITVSGTPIKTDDTSQSRINLSCAYLAAATSVASVQFRAATGYVTLSRAQMFAVNDAVGAFRQGCFDAESAIDAKISAGTYATTADIDGAAEWPSNVFPAASS